MNAPWEVTIRRGQNGYRLSWKEERDDGTLTRVERYIEEKDESEIESAEQLCWDILEYFGIFPSKYAKEVIHIYREHGSDYICQEKDCEICEK